MKAEIKRVRNPINAMDNPKTPIEHKGTALSDNLQGKNGDGKIILPEIKLSNTK